MHNPDSPKDKTAFPNSHIIENTTLHHLTTFLSRHPPGRLSRNLRTMLLEFLQHDESLEAPYLKDLLFDLQGLFELLEGMEKLPVSS